MLVLLVVCILIIVILGIFYFSVLGSLRSDAPFVPSGRKELRWILTEVAKVRPCEVFYDLGSGDGRVARAAGRLGARAIGIEQSRLLVLWSRFLNVILKSRDIRIVHGNYIIKDLSDANVIFCYLMPKAMARLKEKFEKELKPGARVISRAFKIPGWTIAERHQFRKRTPPVYEYYNAEGRLS